MSSTWSMAACEDSKWCSALSMRENEPITARFAKIRSSGNVLCFSENWTAWALWRVRHTLSSASARNWIICVIASLSESTCTHLTCKCMKNCKRSNNNKTGTKSNTAPARPMHQTLSCSLLNLLFKRLSCLPAPRVPAWLQKCSQACFYSNRKAVLDLFGSTWIISISHTYSPSSLSDPPTHVCRRVSVETWSFRLCSSRNVSACVYILSNDKHIINSNSCLVHLLQLHLSGQCKKIHLNFPGFISLLFKNDY